MPEVIVEGAGDSKVEVTILGSGREVGRSAALVKFRDKQVLFDCGIHPAMSGLQSLPFFDEIDCSEIDLCLVTHFHLDHCGAVPYFTECTGFQGKIVMTHPTKKIFRMVMKDFINVTNESVDVCKEEWLENSLSKIDTLDYHQEGQHNGIKFHSYNAGHVLGAAMWMIDIAGVRILYTGDFSREADRHLMGAETPMVAPDVVIVEATYGIQIHDAREEREAKFTKWIHDTVSRGGRCLLPVFALGRAQELLLILDEYWAEHKDLQSIPIYYASSLAKRCNTVFESYISLMNERVQKQYDIIKHKRNPFVFKHITLMKDLKAFDDNGPCVVLASPGMLQSGVSRELFEKWCTDERNSVVISGYCVAGTLAQRIQSRPSHVQDEHGRVLPLRCSVHTVAFSAHSDFKQTQEFVQQIGVKHAVLVHGDPNNMDRLKERLMQDFAYLTCHAPGNGKEHTVVIPFQPQRMAKVIGRAAANDIDYGSQVQGIMVVGKDFQHTLLHPKDLASYTELPVAELKQAVYVPLPKYYPLSDIKDHLARYFAGVTMLAATPDIQMEDADESQQITISGEVSVFIQQTTSGGDEVTTVGVSWLSSRYADVIADSCCLALLNLVNPPTQKMPQDSSDQIFRLRCMHKFLAQHYLGVHLHLGEERFTFDIDGEQVTIIAPFQVDCDDEDLRQRVEAVVHKIFLAVWPMPEDFGWCGCGNHHGDTCEPEAKKRKILDVEA